jgi:hypothetical protein
MSKGTWLVGMAALAVLVVLAVPRGDPDTDKADTGDGCTLKDGASFLDRLKANPLACALGAAGGIQGEGSFNQVFYTWNQGALTETSSPLPAPTATQETSQSITDSATTTFTIQHYAGNGKLVSTSTVGAGEAAILQVIYQETAGPDRIVISQGDAALFDQAYT